MTINDRWYDRRVIADEEIDDRRMIVVKMVDDSENENENDRW